MALAGPVRGLVITGFGLNCEAETSQALRLAGAEADLVHFNDLLHGKASLLDYHIHQTHTFRRKSRAISAAGVEQNLADFRSIEQR